MALASQTYLFLDCQTTGLSRNRAEILELGWSLSFDESAVETRLIKPEKLETISKTVWRMTGIQPSDLADAMDVTQVWKELVLSTYSIDNPVVCAVIHYSQFEMPFLQAVHRQVFPDTEFPWPVVCTHQLARRLHADLPARTLRALSGHFGFVLPEEHRSRGHVIATQKIWRQFLSTLESNQSVATWEDFQSWLRQPVQKNRTKKTFQVSKTFLKTLPEQPGVYEMVSRSGVVLYVGKATSLKSRVGSYFQQRRPERSKLNELLTQVAEVRVVQTETPLEAALLENDRIKNLQPQYNYSLRSFSRCLYFATPLSENYSTHYGFQNPWGPFTSVSCFESLHRLLRMHADQSTEEDIRYLVHPVEDIKAALVRVLERNQVASQSLSVVSLLTLGKRLDGPLPEDEIEASIYRKLKRVPRSLHQAAFRCWILDCRIAWRVEAGQWRYLELCDGKVIQRGCSDTWGQMPNYCRSRHPLRERKRKMNLEIYDRTRVLITELGMIAKRVPVKIQVSPSRTYHFTPDTVLTVLKRAIGTDLSEEADS
jgi:DNA polymerase III subunit epsilon